MLTFYTAQVATKNWTTSKNVILVPGEGYADAVSASTLAKKLDAPILLTTAEALNQNTSAALTLSVAPIASAKEEILLLANIAIFNFLIQLICTRT